MAKQRLINTKFWVDDYTSNLDPTEKLLFLYFLTNPYTDICGIYEVPLKHISLETGLDKEMVLKIVARFTKDGKIFYENGWVAIKNFAKHQVQNPSVKKGVARGLSLVPQQMIDRLVQAVPSVSGAGTPNLNLNLNSNLTLTKLNTGADAQVKKSKYNLLGEQILKAFEEVDSKNKTYYGNTTQRKACDFLLQEYGLEEILKRISVLPQTNKQSYFPRINSPYDLKEKWVKLNDAVLNFREEKQSKKLKIII